MHSSTMPPEPQRAVTHMFNSTIAAAAIGAAWEVGLLDEVRAHEAVHVPTYASSHDLDRDSLQGMAVALATVGVLAYDQKTATARPAALFDATFRSRSLFHWLVLGSGGLFGRMQRVVRNETRADYARDPAAIAYACREISTNFYDPTFWNALAALDGAFHAVVDLGSGSGERLMQILDRFPTTKKAIGVDVAAPAVAFAEAVAQQRGFGDRLSFVVGDATNLDAGRPGFADVDLLTCFMMGHDFWPRDACVARLRHLRHVFPKVQRFLLGDSTRGLLRQADGAEPPAAADDEVPLFPLGFEFGHALMGVYIPTVDEWYGVFAEGGWECLKCHRLPELAFGVIFELKPLD